MMCGGAVSHPWMMPMQTPFVGYHTLPVYPPSPWDDINALRNAADGKKAYCAYCGSMATWEDGKSCPKCGATDVEMK
jgi:ribosomal protein S27AE